MKKGVFLPFLIVLLTGCGGVKVLDKQPWPDPSPDERYIYETASATSKDMQTAIDKATQIAMENISKKVEAYVQSLTKLYRAETGANEDSEFLQDFTSVSKTLADLTLSNINLLKKEVGYGTKDKSYYRAYVLLRFPMYEYKERLLNEIKRREKLYTRLRSTQPFIELEREVEKNREYKKQQEKEFLGE